MAISVQLTPDELAELRQQAITLAKDMSAWLQNNQGDDDYFERAGKLRELIAQLDIWEKQGVDIMTDTNLAGTAIDHINQATEALQHASKKVVSIGANIEAFGAFVDLMVAISSGKPDAIIKQGIALRDAATAASVAAAGV